MGVRGSHGMSTQNIEHEYPCPTEHGQRLFMHPFSSFDKWEGGGDALGTPFAAHVVCGRSPQTNQAHKGSSGGEGARDLRKRHDFEMKILDLFAPTWV